jgi:uncharacterized FlgJ-related protein
VFNGLIVVGKFRQEKRVLPSFINQYKFMEKFRALLILAVIYSISLLVIAANKDIEPKRIVKVITKVIPENPDEFTPEKFKEYLISLNIKHYKIVFAQSKLETGNFTSQAFLNSNNLFGMKIALSRPTTSCGKYKSYARYNSWRESVLDYALYYSKYLSKFRTQTAYLNYLSKHYASDSNYINKLKNLIK